MIKMKYLWNLPTMIIAAMLSVSILACGDDDNDKANGGDVSDLIQILKTNKWTTRDSSYGEGSNNHAWVDIDTWILYFKSDHSGVSYWIQKDYDTDLGNSASKGYSLFEYSVSGNEVTIIYEDSNILKVYYQGGYLTTESFGTLFEPTKMESDDYEFVKTLGPQTKTSGGITYTYDDRTRELKISGNGDMKNYSIGSQPWKEYNIKKVTIEEGVTSVGDNAFYNMLQIEKIDLPNSLKKIGKQAFAKTAITEVVIPLHVEEICAAAFLDCNYLRSIYFSYDSNRNGNLRTIGDYAFYGCKINNYMTFPNQLETVGLWAFTGTFTIIDLGKNIKSIGMGAFTSSAKEGALWINRGNPPAASSQVTDRDGSWSLHIPVGCRANYSTQEPWKNFKVIYESDKLDNDEGAGGTGQRDNASGKTFTETVNGVSFKMIGVVGGSFNMGSPDSELSESQESERPVHRVTLSSFSIGETEVTQELWKAVMGTNPSNQAKGNKHPVENISWDDCQEFIRKLNNISGKNYRLPTEAEWEFSARGGTKSKGYKYAGSNTLNEVAWYNGYYHSEVAQKKENELGLYDMIGNVAEWVNDYWAMDYYSISPQNNPTGPATGYLYVVRGGSVTSLEVKYCRNASRSAHKPEAKVYSCGFRLGL